MDLRRLYKVILEDDETEGILMIGEIGGEEEEKCGRIYFKFKRKKQFSIYSWTICTKGKRMGHAGAIVSGSKGTAHSKN